MQAFSKICNLFSFLVRGFFSKGLQIRFIQKVLVHFKGKSMSLHHRLVEQSLFLKKVQKNCTRNFDRSIFVSNPVPKFSSQPSLPTPGTPGISSWRKQNSDFKKTRLLYKFLCSKDILSTNAKNTVTRP